MTTKVNNGTRFAGGGGNGLGSGQIIGRTSYWPSTAATPATTSSTFSDIDATNLAVTFVVPPSGSVSVELEAISTITNDTIYQWGLIEGSTLIKSQMVMYHNSGNQITQRSRVRIVVNGLTPGATKTYKWAHARVYGSGTARAEYGGSAIPNTSSDCGPALMVVQALDNFSSTGLILPNTYGVGIDDPMIFADAFGLPFAEDAEFNRAGYNTDLPSGWSWVNQGSSSYLEAAGAGVVTSPGAANVYNWRGIVRNLPAAWTLATMKTGITTRAGSDVAFGLCLRESGTGKLLTFYLYTNNGAVSDVYIATWSSPTAYTATVSGPNTPYPLGRPTYYRVRKNSATSWDFEFSSDGYTWYQMLGAYNPAGVTYDQIGIAGYNSSSGVYAFSESLHWMRFR